MSSARWIEAAPGEGDHVGLCRAPLRECAGPLLGAPQGVDVVAALDHAAVDDPGDHRRQLVRRHGDHRLVEQRQALVDPSPLDQRGALGVEREREQVGVAETLADRRGLGAAVVRGLVFARDLVAHGDGDQQVAALRAVGLGSLEQPPRAAEPTRGPRRLASQRQVEREPEGAADRAQRLTVLEQHLVLALEQARPLVLVAQHVSRHGEQVEVVRSEWSRPVGARQRLVRLCPRPSCIGLTAAFEVLDLVHVTPHVFRAPAPWDHSWMGDLLLTGATGFVGRELLRRLLERDDRNVHALVRADDDEAAADAAAGTRAAARLGRRPGTARPRLGRGARGSAGRAELDGDPLRGVGVVLARAGRVAPRQRRGHRARGGARRALRGARRARPPLLRVDRVRRGRAPRRLRRGRPRRRPELPQSLRALQVRGRAAAARLLRAPPAADPAAEHRRRRQPHRLDLLVQRALPAAARLRPRRDPGAPGAQELAGRRRPGGLRRRLGRATLARGAGRHLPPCRRAQRDDRRPADGARLAGASSGRRRRCSRRACTAGSSTRC